MTALALAMARKGGTLLTDEAADHEPGPSVASVPAGMIAAVFWQSTDYRGFGSALSSPIRDLRGAGRRARTLASIFAGCRYRCRGIGGYGLAGGDAGQTAALGGPPEQLARCGTGSSRRH